MSRTLRLVDSDATAPAGKPLRVAIATNDMENLNAHFGSAKMFAVYDVTRTGASFVEVHEFSKFTAQSGKHDDQDDKITPKIEAIAGSAILFALAVGGPSAAKLVKAGIHPIKRKGPEPISEVLEQVQVMLNGNPPPFLRKILGTEKKPDFMDDIDDYQEETV